MVGRARLPKSFWWLLAVAVVLGNTAMFLLIRWGVPDYIAVATPIAAIGAVGVIHAYRERKAGKGGGE